MRKVTYYLGGDNQTGKVDYDAVAEFVASYWEGATIIRTLGVWKGQVEESAMILVYTDAGADVVTKFRELLRLHFAQEEVYLDEG